MHRGVCGYVCSCLYKYSNLFHSVDSYFTERKPNITAPLRTDKAITQYVSFIKHSSILPQQSATLSNASSALLQAAPSQTSALSWANITQPRWKRGKSMQGRARRVESLALLWSKVDWQDLQPCDLRHDEGPESWWCNNVCLLYFVHCRFCVFVSICFKKIFTWKPSELPTEAAY